MKLDFMLGFWFMLVQREEFRNDVSLFDFMLIFLCPSLLNSSQFTFSQAKALSCYFVREFMVPVRAERNSTSIYNENIFLFSLFLLFLSLSLGNAAHTQIYCIISHAPLLEVRNSFLCNLLTINLELRTISNRMREKKMFIFIVNRVNVQAD
jgi:hypothetical protein